MKYIKLIIIHILAYNQVLLAQTEMTWNAQTNFAGFSDTLIVKLSNEHVIYFTGLRLKEIENRKPEIQDVLFNLRNDLQSAIQNNQIPEHTTEILYLYKAKGQRRIKAESPEYSERNIDVQYEIFRLNNNLPKIRIRVYDLTHNIPIYIYSKSIESLIAELNQIQFDDIFNAAFVNKKLVKNSTEITVEKKDSTIKLSNTAYKKYIVDAQPIAGPVLVGGHLGAGFGINLMYRKINKYGFASKKFGLGFNTTSLYRSGEGGLSFIQSYEFVYMKLISQPKTNEAWSGFQIGLAHANYSWQSEIMPKLSLSYTNNTGITWLWDNYFNFDSGFIIGFTVKFPL